MNRDRNKVVQFVSKKILSVHHRNGGSMVHLDLNLSLEDASLLLDSLDLAEIVAEIEQEYKANFEDIFSIPSWNHVVDVIVTSQCKH